MLCVDDRRHNFESGLMHLADGSGDGHMSLGVYGVLDCGDKTRLDYEKFPLESLICARKMAFGVAVVLSFRQYFIYGV